MDCNSPSLLVINGSLFRKGGDHLGSFESLTQMVLPGEVEEEEQPTKMPQLKLKWRAVSRILYAVSRWVRASKLPAIMIPKLPHRKLPFLGFQGLSICILTNHFISCELFSKLSFKN